MSDIHLLSMSRSLHTDASTIGTHHHAVDHEPDPGARSAKRVHWGWLGLWALLTACAVFEVIKHGFVNGSATQAAILTATAIGFFIAPDLTFLVGASRPVQHGYIATTAVPWYNSMHRMWVPLVLTSAVGVVLAPLAFGPLAVFIGGLSWMAHIALDRAAGYSLRNADGSRDRA